MDKAAMYKLSYGLFVLTAKENEKENGCIINTAMQVTTTPNRMIIVVNKQNYTHDMIMRTKAFNVSCLSENAKFDVFQHFGFQSGRDVDKMAGKSYPLAENGIAYVDDVANAYISGKVISKVLNDVESVTYTFYQKNIKPAPQPAKKTGWVCKICGYVYEGEELPADFICPFCKHPASDFEKI